MQTSTLSRKICLLGDFAVGKTSLVRRFVHDLFDDKYISTIGVKVSSKKVVVPRSDELVELNLVIWDLAGSEEFSAMRASYLRGASGALMVCDLTRPSTLHSLNGYARDLWAVSPDARVIFAANKHDLIKHPPPGAGEHLALEAVQAAAAGFDAPYYPTSAKTGEQVEDLFRHLGRMLLAA
jgi:small GTP-binding protein